MDVGVPADSAPRQKSTAWCFTENNPRRTNLFPHGLPDGVRYIVYQLERGEQGTPHLQGYIHLQRQQRMSWLKGLKQRTVEGEEYTVFERAHFIAAKGSAAQNKAYCTKTEGRVEGPWELGEQPKGQGQRTDLEAAAKILIETGDINAIDRTVLMMHPSGCMKLASLAKCPRRENMKIITIIGRTGIGKSYSVHDMCPDVYVIQVGNSGLWWDGYTGQKAILFEEYKGQVQLQKMLQILDPYPLRLEIKGGSVPARFDLVFITSNSTPDKWYKNEGGDRDEEMKALARRLDAADPTAIPPRPSGPRFIQADTREELHQKLSILRVAGIIPKHREAAEAAAAAADVPLDEAAAACDTSSQYSEEEAPRLKRHNASIVVIPDDEDMAPQP